MQLLALGAARFVLGALHQKLRGRKKVYIMNSQIIIAKFIFIFLVLAKTYLGVIARIYYYNFCNQLLILVQRPESTHVAGYYRCQAVEAQVRSGISSFAFSRPGIG